MVLSYNRRRILHFAVTAHPTAEWTAHQMREAFPWDSARHHGICCATVTAFSDKISLSSQAGAVGTALTMAACLCRARQGTIRRECLDHVIVVNETSLRCHLQEFRSYYHRSRTHLGLRKDTPEPRPVQPPEVGRIISIPEVGGLHHRYERRAA